VSNDYLLLIAQFVAPYSVINLLNGIWITLNEVNVIHCTVAKIGVLFPFH
jgi:hypothetical protein